MNSDCLSKAAVVGHNAAHQHMHHHNYSGSVVDAAVVDVLMRSPRRRQKSKQNTNDFNRGDAFLGVGRLRYQVLSRRGTRRKNIEGPRRFSDDCVYEHVALAPEPFEGETPAAGDLDMVSWAASGTCERWWTTSQMAATRSA